MITIWQTVYGGLHCTSMQATDRDDGAAGVLTYSLIGFGVGSL